MKTPEEMAEEWARDWHKDCDYPEEILKHTIEATKTTFLAGYKAAQQWISVKDRLPEMNKLCIVNTEWRGVVPATYGNESWIFDDGQGWSEKALSYASYWMELPAPPKEDK